MSRADGNSTRLITYPPAIRVAALLWILVGTVVVVADFIYPIIVTVLNENTQDPAHVTASLVDGLFRLAIGGFFLYEGVAVIRATIPSTVGVAAGSLLFAAVFLGVAVFLVRDSQLSQKVAPCFAAVVLVVAGVLAFVGRRSYEAWRKAKSHQTSRS